MSISPAKAQARFRAYVQADNFYQTRSWKLKCKEAKRRACGKCEGYGCNEYSDLDVHHLIPRFQDPDRALDPKNLIVLCRRCHSAYHHWIKGYSTFSAVQPANDAQFELPFEKSS